MIKHLAIAAVTLLALAACSDKKEKNACGAEVSAGSLTSCTAGIKGERATNGSVVGYWLAPEGMSALNSIAAGKDVCSQLIKKVEGKPVFETLNATYIDMNGDVQECYLRGSWGSLECSPMGWHINLEKGNVTGGPCDLSAKLQNDVLTMEGQCGGLALFPITEQGYRVYIGHGEECLRKANGGK